MSLRKVTLALTALLSFNAGCGSPEPTSIEDRAFVGHPSFASSEGCPWYEWGCNPYTPTSDQDSAIRGRAQQIYDSQCSRSHDIKDALIYRLDNGRLKMFDGSYYPTLGGDYHHPGELVHTDEIHINDSLGSEDFIRILIHEARHANGETHDETEAYFPDEFQVLDDCDGP